MSSVVAGQFIKKICQPHQNVALVNFTHDITFGKNQISMIISDSQIASHYFKNQIPTLCTDESGRTLLEGIYLNRTLENTRKDCTLLMPLLRDIGLKYQQNYGKNSIHLVAREKTCQHLYSLFFDLEENDFLQWVINNGNFLNDFIENYKTQSNDLVLEAKSIENRMILPTTRDWAHLKNWCDINDHNGTLTILHKDLQLPVHLPRQQGRCLLLMVQGKSAKEIAQELKISHRTVECYFDKTRKQLGCSSNKKLIAAYGNQLQ